MEQALNKIVYETCILLNKTKYGTGTGWSLPLKLIKGPITHSCQLAQVDKFIRKQKLKNKKTIETPKPYWTKKMLRIHKLNDINSMVNLFSNYGWNKKTRNKKKKQKITKIKQLRCEREYHENFCFFFI